MTTNEFNKKTGKRLKDFGAKKNYVGDLKAFMKKIVDSHVAFYKTDLGLDFDIIVDSFKNWKDEDDDTVWFLWLVRPCGTRLLKLEEVFIDGSPANTIWRYYAEQESDQKYLAFILTVSKEMVYLWDNKKYIPDFYGVATELNYLDSYKFICKNSSLDENALYDVLDSIVIGINPRKEIVPVGDLDKRLAQIKKENMAYEIYYLMKKINAGAKRVQISSWYSKIADDKDVKILAKRLNLKLSVENNSLYGTLKEA